MTTANIITLFRVILIPVFLILLYTGAKWAALAVYIVACISDTVDGYIARHYNQVTDFGKFMDPLADKILVLSAMCWFIEVGQMHGWLVAIVLFREFAVSGNQTLDTVCGLLTLLTTVCSGAEYFWKNRDVFSA